MSSDFAISDSQRNDGPLSERRTALIHRVIVPDTDYPKEYAILVTDRRSIFIRHAKTRSNFWLRGEMRWGTALVTDVMPKTMQDYEETTLERLSEDPTSISIPHEAVVSLSAQAERPSFRPHEFWVKWGWRDRRRSFRSITSK